MSSARKIVKSDVQTWKGLWTGAKYGVRVTFDDGVVIGMAIGLKEQAESVAKVAIGKGDEFVDALFALQGVTNRHDPSSLHKHS